MYSIFSININKLCHKLCPLKSRLNVSAGPYYLFTIVNILTLKINIKILILIFKAELQVIIKLHREAAVVIYFHMLCHMQFEF